jgi:hypothetical protein
MVHDVSEESLVFPCNYQVIQKSANLEVNKEDVWVPS